MGKHWSEIQVGDTVAIKGVRSRMNGRRREMGTVRNIDQYGQAEVESGCFTYIVSKSSLIHVSN